MHTPPMEPAAKRQRAVLTHDAENTNKNFNLFYRLRTGGALRRAKSYLLSSSGRLVYSCKLNGQSLKSNTFVYLGCRTNQDVCLIGVAEISSNRNGEIKTADVLFMDSGHHHTLDFT